MKCCYLLLLFVTLATLLHAGRREDSGYLDDLTPGEVGRPKVTPRFEIWGEQTAQGLSQDLDKQSNLTLYQLDGSPIKLSTLWADKPVLLVHSSLTCPISRDNCPHVDRIQKNFGDQINVVVLYTTEAHPVGSPSPYSEGGKLEWLTERNIFDEVLVNEPKTLKARLTRAKEYRDRQKIKSRLVVDSMTNDVWKFFGAGPNTGIFITKEGRVLNRQGWLKPSLMTGSIRSYLATLKRTRVYEQLKQSGHKADLWNLQKIDYEKISKDVPDFLSHNVNIKGASSGETLLHLAVEKGDTNLIARLLSLGAPVDGQDQSGITPLFYALRSSSSHKKNECVEMIRLLLENKASTRHRSDSLETATHFAVRSDNLSHVKMILEAGAPLDSYSIDGISPLHQALLQNNDEIARFLISEGASKDIFAAAALGDLKNVQRFLVNKPNAWNSFQGDSGRSPLYYAALSGKIEMVNFLLAQQTSKKKYSNEQLNACLKIGIKHQATEVCLSLAPHAFPLTGENAPPQTQSLQPQAPTSMPYWDNPIFHEATALDNADLLTILLERGWDIDALSPDEETPLHHAALSGNSNAIKLLAEKGADLDAKSGSRRAMPCGPGHNERRNDTPLHLAVRSGKPPAVEILLKYGAKPNVNNTDGITPICDAFPVPDYIEANPATRLAQSKAIVKMLIKAGADPDKPADCGKSFRDLASELIKTNEKIDGEWVKTGESPRSPELVKFLDEIKGE